MPYLYTHTHTHTHTRTHTHTHTHTLFFVFFSPICYIFIFLFLYTFLLHYATEGASVCLSVCFWTDFVKIIVSQLCTMQSHTGVRLKWVMQINTPAKRQATKMSGACRSVTLLYIIQYTIYSQFRVVCGDYHWDRG